MSKSECIERMACFLVLIVLLAGCGGGGADYSTREPPTASITSIQAGDRSLLIKYTLPSVPAGASLSSVALVTASCTAGSDQRTATATDTSSPIEILNLLNGVEYSCTVTTKSVSGVTRTSTPVRATPSLSYSVSVVPSVNGLFLAGARVDVYLIASGRRIASSTTASSGRASLTFSASSNDLALIVVSGTNSARFYSYSTDSLVSFGEKRNLFAVIPVSTLAAVQTAVTINPITTAIAIAAGIDPERLTAEVPFNVTAASLNSGIVKVLIALGVDPTTYSPTILPALLGNADLGRRVTVFGTDAELLYGLLLVSISSLRSGNEDLLSFIETFIKALAAGNASSIFQNISVTLPAKFESSKETLVDSVRRATFSATIVPEAARYDYANFDENRYQ
jgi:hypothetical protein